MSKVGVVGAGPVGLYAAHEFVKRGHDVMLFEQSSEVAGGMRSWNFVRLFSPLELNVPPSVLETLKAKGCTIPDMGAFLTGGQFVESILVPLMNFLKESGKVEVKFGCKVLSLGRGKFLKSDAIEAAGDSSRAGKSFRILYKNIEDMSETIDCSCNLLVDASGSYDPSTGNYVGIGGMPAPGERRAEAEGCLHRIMLDVKGEENRKVAGRRVAVVGTGYSASTALKNLNDLALAGGEGAPAEVYWLTRKPAEVQPYNVVENDALPERNELAKFSNAVASHSSDVKWGQTKFEYIPHCGVAAFTPAATGYTVTIEVGEEGTPRDLALDTMFALVGFHPNKEMWSELQVHTCYASDGPMKLAASLLAAKMGGSSAGAGDCLKQAAPGPQTLLNPEPDFFILGMKSYGRHSTFLMRVGYEQVDLLMQQLQEKAA